MRQGVVHHLSHMALETSPVHAFVDIPLGDVVSEEVNDVMDLALLHTCSEKPLSPHQLSVSFEVLGSQIEARRASLPEDVVEVNHATGRRPLEDPDVCAGTEVWDRHRLEAELQAHCAIPRHKERVLVDELPAPLEWFCWRTSSSSHQTRPKTRLKNRTKP